MCFLIRFSELENEMVPSGFPDECGSQTFNTLVSDYFIQSSYLHVFPVMVNDRAEHLGTMQKGSCADVLFL